MLRDAEIERARERHYQAPDAAAGANCAALLERPAMLLPRPGDVEPRFQVCRFDRDTGERTWMTAWASELTEAEIAALEPEEQSAVRAALEIDDPAIGAVHGAEPAPETLAECEAAAAE